MTSERHGLFVLVVGPSGAGKDTLMEAARAATVGNPRVRFVQRHVTRPREAGGEVHWPMTVAAFEAERASGGYCLSWGAHGLLYGIPADVITTVRDGAVCVVNGSRRTLIDAAGLGVPMAVIVVTAPPGVLAARLARRGREAEADIRERLAREAPLPALSCPVIAVINDGTVAEGAARFVAALSSLVSLADAATAPGSACPEPLA